MGAERIVIYASLLAGIASTWLLACLSPGPSFVVISSTAIAVSRWAGVLLGLSVAAAHLTWATAVMAGLGVLLSHVPWLYKAFKLMGAAYLAYLGLKMILAAWRGQAAMDMKPVPTTTAGRYLGKGYLVAISNPTAAIFFGSVFSAMLPSAAPLWVYLSAIGVVAGVSLFWHGGIAIAFSLRPIQIAYRHLKRSVDGLTGSVLVLLGVRLALAR